MDNQARISKAEMVKAIAQHEVFNNLDDQSLINLEEILEYITVDNNSQVFQIGDQPNKIYYLLKGSLTLKFPDNSKLLLTPGELIGEIGLLNGDFRLGTLTANEDSQLISICGTRIFNSKFMSPESGLDVVRKLSRRVTNYLRSVQQTSTQELITKGESEFVEFKSTLRWNLKADKKDKNITHAVLKTIAAFLNSEGGILLIGVSDDNKLLGLASDRFENHDKLLLHLTNTIKSQLGTLHIDHVHFHIERIQDKDVLRIDVQAGITPCYLSNDKGEYFYIRTGPSTTDLKISKAYDFIKNRFYHRNQNSEN